MNACRDAAAVRDGPHHERLAARGVTCREDARHARGAVLVGDDVAAAHRARPSSSTRPAFSGWMKPIARSARSHGSSARSRDPDELAARQPRRERSGFLPPFPEASGTKAFVATANSGTAGRFVSEGSFLRRRRGGRAATPAMGSPACASAEACMSPSWVTEAAR